MINSLGTWYLGTLISTTTLLQLIYKHTSITACEACSFPTAYCTVCVGWIYWVHYISCNFLRPVALSVWATSVECTTNRLFFLRPIALSVWAISVKCTTIRFFYYSLLHCLCGLDLLSTLHIRFVVWTSTLLLFSPPRHCFLGLYKLSIQCWQLVLLGFFLSWSAIMLITKQLWCTHLKSLCRPL